MTSWPKDAREFTVSMTHNRQRGTSYSYIPKPILRMPGNPDGLKFTVRDGYIEVSSPDE